MAHKVNVISLGEVAMTAPLQQASKMWLAGKLPSVAVKDLEVKAINLREMYCVVGEMK